MGGDGCGVTTLKRGGEQKDSGVGLADDSVVTSHVLDQSSGSANYPEIVGFLQKNWNKVSMDEKCKVYQGD